MKAALLGLGVFLTATVQAQNISKVPFYFAVTEEAHLELAPDLLKKIPVKNPETAKAYLKGKHYPDGSKNGRKAAFAELVKKGVIQTGDVVLSFRPTWEKTVPYSHLQMGVSHVGLAYVENGQVKNLDMPLDAEYNGANISSGFDSKHYLETPHIHIVRPRNFTDAKKSNFLAWIGELRKNYSKIRAQGLLKFNSDYSSPKFDTYSKGDEFVGTMAKILVGEDTVSRNLTMFCSEYAWAMLSLANCSPSEVKGKASNQVSCIEQIFSPMYMTSKGNIPGLTEGPFEVLKALDSSSSEIALLTEELFTQGKMEDLSSGHRALATNPQVRMLMEAMMVFYPTKLGDGNSPVAKGISDQVNQVGGRNYSPASFLINTMVENSNPERKFDYVATIMFGN